MLLMGAGVYALVDRGRTPPAPPAPPADWTEVTVPKVADTKPVTKSRPVAGSRFRPDARSLPYPEGTIPGIDNQILVEGHLVPAFGYRTSTKTGFPEWNPGRRHGGGYLNLIAGSEERTWLPADGYRWATDDPFDPKVVKK